MNFLARSKITPRLLTPSVSKAFSFSLRSVSSRQQLHPYSTTTTRASTESTDDIWQRRPKEISYNPATLANPVNLIGYVKGPVRFESAVYRESRAVTTISQENRIGEISLLIPVIFEGDLADIAARHVKENDYVYVAGQLCDDLGGYCVVAKNLNFVEGFWRDLLTNPEQWWDYREHKCNGVVKEKNPDFMHKSRDHGLWVHRAPNWVLPLLENLHADVKDLKVRAKPVLKLGQSNSIQPSEKQKLRFNISVNRETPDLRFNISLNQENPNLRFDISLNRENPELRLDVCINRKKEELHSEMKSESSDYSTSIEEYYSVSESDEGEDEDKDEDDDASTGVF